LSSSSSSSRGWDSQMVRAVCWCIRASDNRFEP
jgi:hypothetical protein